MLGATFKHILLFEQHAGVRQLMHEVLEEAQYRVSLASSGSEARQALEQGDVDLMIANVAQTGGEARDVAGYAASVGLPCVLIAPGRMERKSFEQDAAAFVEPPFTLKHLCNEVARTLVARPVPSVDG